MTGEEKLEKSEDKEEVGELHMFANEIFHGILHFSANYNDPFNFQQVGVVIPDAGAVRQTL